METITNRIKTAISKELDLMAEDYADLELTPAEKAERVAMFKRKLEEKLRDGERLPEFIHDLITGDNKIH